MKTKSTHAPLRWYQARSAPKQLPRLWVDTKGSASVASLMGARNKRVGEFLLNWTLDKQQRQIKPF